MDAEPCRHRSVYYGYRNLVVSVSVLFLLILVPFLAKGDYAKMNGKQSHGALERKRRKL